MRYRPHIGSVCRTLPTPDDPSGGVFVWRRIEALARRTDVSAVQPIPYFPALRPLPGWAAASPNHEAGELGVQHAPMFYLPKVLKSLDAYWLRRAVLRKLGALKRAGRLDLIDAHFGYPDGAGCVRAGRELGVPVFITIRGVEADNLRTPMIREQVRRALTLADGCIAVSHSLKELVMAAGVPAQNVTVIPNAVDRSLFRPRDRRESRCRLGLPADAPLVVSVGNLLSVKGHDVLIAAFAQIRGRKPDARLVIVGGSMHEPAYPQQLQAQCRRLGVENAVR
ncbi:MAG TPA: glycosyltransferase, partial [Woeseiaceae bacterium]|nr:glycosyltransferase [Woeseiaceae bacterium]